MSEADWDARFAGITRLYGVEAADRIKQARLCVIGVGGVGSWAAEALVRSGVAAVRLVDLDDVCLSNTNRQSHALTNQVGQYKVDTLAARLRLINPACEVESVTDFVSYSNLDTVLTPPLDGVLDCIDSVVAKTDLLNGCRRRKLCVVSTGGAGGRVDPTRLYISDLNTVRGDALSASVRSRLRQRYGYSRNPKRRYGIPTVYSDEPVRHAQADGSVSHHRAKGAAGRLDCAGGLGASMMVTATFGMTAAAELLRRVTASAKPSVSGRG